MTKRVATKDRMVEIAPADRNKATSRVEYLRKKGNYLRLEKDRPSDLPLVTLCLMSKPPAHIRQVHRGIFAVDLPADVFKTVWMVSDGFVVGTYATAAQRAEDL